MKVLSFDVGIKNMAYCILQIDNSNVEIVDWNIINLMDEVVEHICSCSQKNGKLCSTKAKYYQNDNYYCEKHAKSSKIRIYNKKFSSTQLNRLKKNDLLSLISNENIPIDTNNNKDVLVHDINDYVLKHSLQKLNISKKTANETDLVTIGRNMKTKMDVIENFSNITHVLIENQISPIANRMKTVQGMLSQYFIMKHESSQIEFISSKNKLKGLDIINENEASQYKQHKKDAIFHTNNILEKYFPTWKSVMSSSKKDDLADALLQGLMYLKYKYNIIRV